MKKMDAWGRLSNLPQVTQLEGSRVRAWTERGLMATRLCHGVVCPWAGDNLPVPRLGHGDNGSTCVGGLLRVMSETRPTRRRPPPDGLADRQEALLAYPAPLPSAFLPQGTI